MSKYTYFFSKSVIYSLSVLFFEIYFYSFKKKFYSFCITDYVTCFYYIMFDQGKKSLPNPHICYICCFPAWLAVCLRVWEHIITNKYSCLCVFSLFSCWSLCTYRRATLEWFCICFYWVFQGFHQTEISLIIAISD